MKLRSSLVTSMLLFLVPVDGALNALTGENSKRKLAIVSTSASAFELQDSAAVLGEFRKSLVEGGQFEVLSEDQMQFLVREAQFKDIENCTYSHCLADLGKILGVDQVAQTIFARRGKLYTFRLRIINVSDSEILFDRTLEHSGEFQPFVREVVPSMARAVSETKMISSPSYKWYFVGAAVLAFGAAIYFINKSLGSSPNTPDPVNPPDTN